MITACLCAALCGCSGAGTGPDTLNVRKVPLKVRRLTLPAKSTACGLIWRDSEPGEGPEGTVTPGFREHFDCRLLDTYFLDRLLKGFAEKDVIWTTAGTDAPLPEALSWYRVPLGKLNEFQVESLGLMASRRPKTWRTGIFEVKLRARFMGRIFVELQVMPVMLLYEGKLNEPPEEVRLDKMSRSVIMVPGQSFLLRGRGLLAPAFDWISDDGRDFRSQVVVALEE